MKSTRPLYEVTNLQQGHGLDDAKPGPCASISSSYSFPIPRIVRSFAFYVRIRVLNVKSRSDPLPAKWKGHSLSFDSTSAHNDPGGLTPAHICPFQSLTRGSASLSSETLVPCGATKLPTKSHSRYRKLVAHTSLSVAYLQFPNTDLGTALRPIFGRSLPLFNIQYSMFSCLLPASFLHFVFILQLQSPPHKTENPAAAMTTIVTIPQNYG